MGKPKYNKQTLIGWFNLNVFSFVCLWNSVEKQGRWGKWEWNSSNSGTFINWSGRHS